MSEIRLIKPDFVTSPQSFINTNEFSFAANYFTKMEKQHGTGKGYYTNAPEGTHTHQEYWDLMEKYCKEGYTVGGVRITGEHFAYLNFGRIKITEDDGKKARKYEGFPLFTDMDYYYYHALEKAQDLNLGMIISKARRKGFSYKGAFNCVYEYTWYRDSLSIIAAYLGDYAETTMGMSLDMLDFINKHTDWAKRKLVDTKTHIKSGFKETINDVEVQSGFKSEIRSMSFKDNPFKSIGKSAARMLFEEAGKWVGLIDAYMLSRPLFSDGDIMIGTPIIYGCVCAGTKVWTNNGDLINIEDLKQEQGILGFDNQQTNQEEITWMNPPAKKACYRIITNTGTILECSEDHPLLWSKRHFDYHKRETINGKRETVIKHKKVSFKETKDIKKNDQIVLINAINRFADEYIWEPRVLGLLIGDGCYGPNKTPVLSNCDEEILNYINNKFDTSIEREYKTKDNKNYKEIRIKNIVKHLKEEGIYGQTKEKKRLPKSIFKASKYNVCELIAGLIDTDGYVGKKNIVITFAYIDLIKDLKNLLIKIGVHSSISAIKDTRDRFIKSNSTYYRLNISDNISLLNLSKNVTLLCKYKQEALTILKNKIGKSKFKSKCVLVKTSEIDKRYKDLTDVEGIRLETVKSIEYIGVKEIYNLTAGNTHTYIANNIITHNTGGDMQSGTRDFAEMFYNPSAYGLLAFENVWDEKATKNGCGWFVPDSIFKLPYVDKEGNSDIIAAKDAILRKRDLVKATGSKRAYEKEVSQQPLTPQEAFLKTTGNRFPTVDLLARLGKLETDESILNADSIGDLTINEDGKIEWKLNSKRIPIRDFPIRKDEDTEGCIVIYEHPFEDDFKEVPYGRYLAGIDPYAQNKSDSSDSLGATLVYDKMTKRIVAEYTARPSTLNEYYENVRRLLKYYNAICLYENQVPGLFQYLEGKNEAYLLMDQPDYIKDILKDSRVERGKGMHMSQGLKEHGEDLINAWLRESYDGDNDVLNLHKLRCIPLIKELIAYDDEGNYDRAIAFMMIMYAVQQTKKHRIEETKQENDILNQDFFNKVRSKNSIFYPQQANFSYRQNQ